MKTVSIRLDDGDYAALHGLLQEMWLTVQDFYETFTKAVIREGSIPDIIRASASEQAQHDRIDSFERLEPLRKSAGRYLPADFDPDDERGKALDEKYGFQFTPPHESGVRQCRNSEEIQS